MQGIVAAGDATMASSVAAVLQKAVGPEMCMKMQAEGRWHECIFGVTKSSKGDASAAAARQRSTLKAMEWDAKARDVVLVRQPASCLHAACVKLHLGLLCPHGLVLGPAG